MPRIQELVASAVDPMRFISLQYEAAVQTAKVVLRKGARHPSSREKHCRSDRERVEGGKPPLLSPASPPPSRVSRSMSGGRQSAFVSCKHDAGTLACRLRKMRSILLVRREGPTFFDEDGACAGSNYRGGRPNYCRRVAV